jgi:hypothetical protein
MDNAAARMLHVPRGVPIARFQPPAQVPIGPGQEVPLIAKDAPADRKLQEVWTARTRVFDLADVEQVKEYEKVWQRITDGHATFSESRIDFHEGKYVALLRWADFSYKLPTA